MEQVNESKTDIAIIGAGPAGLSAAINAVARGKTVRLFSGSASPLAHAERVDNYLGMSHVSGAEMMAEFAAHAASVGIFPEKGLVSNVFPFDGRFMLNVSGGTNAVVVEASAVILATGAVRANPIAGERELLGRGVSYCATCDGMLYRGKRAVVWGNADDIIHETNFLNNIGVKTVLIDNGERSAELDGGVEYLSGKLLEVTGSDRVTGVITGAGDTVPADVVFILRNTIAPSALIDGLETENGYIKVNRMMETSIPGLFAAGDCTGSPLQIANAVGEGLIAAQSAAKTK